MNTTTLDVDARRLEPPQPMVRILEALDGLPAGGVLRARTDRRPMHLYPLLEDRGFTAETEQEADGSFLTFIRWRDALAAPSAGDSSSPSTRNS